jgi:nucleoside-diphosphate-sugar epimerase
MASFLTSEKLCSDHVFFFSYVQPVQKGNILGMWSNADELAKANCELHTRSEAPEERKLTEMYLLAELLDNFLGGLKLAELVPKRFLLQTGAKHYGFHIGPATSPSFESDPRITLENNFYYPQEDLLSAYCKETGAKWNVVRPSYIIGAVRDNLLNHMVAISVYGAVQAYLKQPLAFPGDFIAWDREYCQSTALLNAYLEEWAVLTPEAGNEAFNAQDGLPFTWGRFWPYLANWYGTTWTPPESDPSKYRVHESRHKGGQPRG